MGAFILGILAGWAIEWLIFTYWWKPTHAEADSGAGGGDCEERVGALEEQIREKEEEVSHLYARIAGMRQEPGQPGESGAAAPEPAVSSGPDDLKKVSGIGPKIQEVLKAAGVESFARLAQMSEAEINDILTQAEVRYPNADVSSWPAQAKFLAAGDAEGLEQLLASLKK